MVSSERTGAAGAAGSGQSGAAGAAGSTSGGAAGAGGEAGYSGAGGETCTTGGAAGADPLGEGGNGNGGFAGDGGWTWLRAWPDLGLFNAEALLAAGQPAPAAWLLGLILYWAAYTMLCLALAAYAFNRREF